MFFSYNMTEFKRENASYLYSHSTVFSTLTNVPHRHKGIEICVMLDGSATFHSEGRDYPVENGDIVIANEDEEHYFTLKSKTFDRVVIGLTNNFFKENACAVYANMFFNRNPGENSLIPSEPLTRFGAHDALLRLENYLKDDTTPENVILACFTELLYNCHRAYSDTYRTYVSSPDLVRKILTYIDRNLTESLTLKSIAEQFFISEQYLCRIFKKATSSTVSEYITQKRFNLYHKLTAGGLSVQKACEKAGFGSYSAFFRAYKKAYGKAPKKVRN